MPICPSAGRRGEGGVGEAKKREGEGMRGSPGCGNVCDGNKLFLLSLLSKPVEAEKGEGKQRKKEGGKKKKKGRGCRKKGRGNPDGGACN